MARHRHHERLEPTDGTLAAAAAPSLGLDAPPASEAERSASDAARGDDLPPEPAPLIEPVRARQGEQGRPYCDKHNCLQRATATRGDVTHYACPVPDCTSRAKRVRPSLKVPAEPMPCPDIRCRGHEHFLEVDPRRSNLVQLHMHCPACGFGLKVPRPQFEDQFRRQRERAAEDLSAR